MYSILRRYSLTSNAVYKLSWHSFRLLNTGSRPSHVSVRPLRWQLTFAMRSRSTKPPNFASFDKVTHNMSVRNTRSVVEDLRAHGRLIEITDEVDPHLELAEIHRRVYRNHGPALLFSNVRGCQFPVATNLFGTLDQAKFIFRHTFAAVQLAVQLKVDPSQAMKHAWKLPILLKTAWSMRPKRVSRAARPRSRMPAQRLAACHLLAQRRRCVRNLASSC